MSPLPFLALLFLLAHSYRPYNGFNHNPFHPTWGMVNQSLSRRSPALYSDDIYAPRLARNGSALPSARSISDIVFAHDGAMPLSHRGLTDFLTFWGQFLDHDLTFTSGDPHGNRQINMTIPVPKGDKFFDPSGIGNVVMEFVRGVIAPLSGNATILPAVPLNLVTSWFDGSQIYGSDDVTAMYLRSLVGGRLKEHAIYKGFPPLNDQPDSPIKMQTAYIANQENLFIFGDARGNENIGLTTLQILFFREHNRRAGVLQQQNPTWSDEEIYQQARKMVIAVLHHITEEEYMTLTLGEHLVEYEEFQPNTSPNVMVDFSTGAFRYGHSEVNSFFLIPEDTTRNVSLRDSYFKPFPLLTNSNNFDQLVAGMMQQTQGAVDTIFVDDLRNYLFGNPGSGGLDLTAINTQRGRDHGLPGFNTFRMNFGLDPYEDWDDINPDPQVWQKLEQAYADIDDCDVYVCGLAEPPHTSTANVGETFFTVIKQQYLHTRDGEPQWYETPDYLTDDELKDARETFLSNIIIQNTGLKPEDVQCYVMALPAGCTAVPPQIPDLESLQDEYDFVVTVVVNNNTGPTDDLENYFVFAINGVSQGPITVETGRNYTFFAHISCGDALIITDVLDETAPESINGQFGCLHQNPVVTLFLDENSPDILYYDSTLHPSMGGNITVVKVPASPSTKAIDATVVGLGAALGVVSLIMLISLYYLFKSNGKKGYSEVGDKI